jgi:hypothetical protein
MELHRVVGEGFPDLKPGDVYRDPAPASTSYDPEVTKNIAVRGRRRDLVIEAPAGSPALYTPAGERGEIVLPSGSALKVVSAEGGTVRARLEPPAGTVPEKGPVPGLEDFRLSPKRKRQLRERIDTYVRVQIGLGKDGDAAEKEITARIADELRSGVTRHAGGEHRRPFAHAGYDPGKHPRGQPGNRGEFGPGGGVSALAERAKANVRAAVGHLPAAVRVPLGNAYHAVHSSLMAVNRSARTLARRVAEERGGSPEHVERLSRVLAAADLVVPGAVGLAVASAGAVAAGKLASYVPVGSMSYVLYSSARNPAAVLRAAGQALGRDFPEAAKGAWRFALGAARHPLTPAATAHAASPSGVGLIDDYLRHFAPQGEFAEAALLAALDETRDVAAAVRMASQVASQRSYAGTDPSKHPHKPKGKGGGQFTKKGAAAGGTASNAISRGETGVGRVPEEKPSEKALRAKAAHHLIDKSVQRYAEEHNEPRFAKAMGGVSFPDGEPADVVIAGPDGRVRHGIELKTMVDNKNNKITMKRSAMERKAAWERKNKATFHTVVLDDHAAFNANGPGEHDESRRRIFYRRGFGSFRVGTMYEVKGGLDELKRLLDMPKNRLPAGAR